MEFSRSYGLTQFGQKEKLLQIIYTELSETLSNARAKLWVNYSSINLFEIQKYIIAILIFLSFLERHIHFSFDRNILFYFIFCLFIGLLREGIYTRSAQTL